MRSVPCPRCGRARQARLLWIVPDRLWFPELSFRLVRCQACRFVYLNPRPDEDEMARHYPDFTHSGSRPPEGTPDAFRWRLGQIERRKRGGRLLDVGCGDGRFLAVALQRGWDAYGLDTSPGAIGSARRELGDRVVLTTLLKASYPAEHFDVVSLFEVLEHLPDVLGHLREIRRILKPEGLVCLSVPNFASLERGVFRRWWAGLDAPRHLQQFTSESLRFFLETSGFAVLELRSVNADRIQARKRAITYCQDSLRFFLRDLGLYPRLIPPTAADLATGEPPDPPLWKKAVHWLEWAAFYPVCLLARWLDRDNTLWAWGQKS